MTKKLPTREEKLGGDYPCADCGQKDNVRWFVENVMWNAVMGDSDTCADKMNDERGKILCIPCFVRRAQKIYNPRAWRLMPEWKWEKNSRDIHAPPTPEAVDKVLEKIDEQIGGALRALGGEKPEPQKRLSVTKNKV